MCDVEHAPFQMRRKMICWMNIFVAPLMLKLNNGTVCVGLSYLYSTSIIPSSNLKPERLWKSLTCWAARTAWRFCHVDARVHKLYNWSQTSCTDYKIIPLGKIQDWIKLSQYYKKITWVSRSGADCNSFSGASVRYSSSDMCGLCIKQKSRFKKVQTGNTAAIKI